jgi:hypothetical protein
MREDEREWVERPLKKQLEDVRMWLCDWDEGVEPGDTVALARKVKDICKQRGHDNVELRAWQRQVNKELTRIIRRWSKDNNHQRAAGGMLIDLRSVVAAEQEGE